MTIWKGASKGKKTDAAAYRGLQIGSMMCKIVVIIILNRIETWYEAQILDQRDASPKQDLVTRVRVSAIN